MENVCLVLHCKVKIFCSNIYDILDHQKFNYCIQFENASKHECMSINNVNSICFIESSKQGFWSRISVSFQVLPKIKTYFLGKSF